MSARFEWLAKRGGTRSHGVLAEPFLLNGGLCGVQVAKLTEWLIDGNLRRCRKCVQIMATEYPSIMPGIADLGGMVNVDAADALNMVEQAKRHGRAGAVVAYLVDQLGVILTPWQVTILERAFGDVPERPKMRDDQAKGISLTRSILDELLPFTQRRAIVEVAAAQSIHGLGACPTCYLPDGFHDHGTLGSRHDAHRVPRHLVRRSASALRRERREGDPRLGAIY